ncbi:MAG: MATE family efflux transporter [Muribaculaceae bacterium]|nr:MATE family efflux transporter [Muribaculaceae bacterium]
MDFKLYRPRYAELLKLGFPVLLTQLGVILMSFTDTMMVGAYGVNELAASAFVNSVFLIPMVMLSGLAAGITPLVGALFSQNDFHEAGRTARAGLQINAIVATAFIAIMTIIYFWLGLFGQPEDIMTPSREYYITLLTAMLPMALFNALSQTSNGLTDTRTPMYFILMGIGLNIFGNWLLIYGNLGCPRLGLMGAGIATSLSRWLTFGSMFAMYMWSGRYQNIRAGIADGEHLGELRGKVWNTSYPVAIQTGIECALWSIGAVVCGWFGKIQLAAYQVINTIGQLGFMTYMSFGVAVSIKVANCTGLSDERGAGLVARAGIHLNLVLATIASLAMLLLSRQLLGIFTPDADVIAAGEKLILPLLMYQYLDATQLTFVNAIRGTGQVKPLLSIASVSYILVGIPALWVCALLLEGESVGVYYSFNIALLAAAIYAAIVFKRLRISPVMDNA